MNGDAYRSMELNNGSHRVLQQFKQHVVKMRGDIGKCLSALVECLVVTEVDAVNYDVHLRGRTQCLQKAETKGIREKDSG